MCAWKPGGAHSSEFISKYMTSCVSSARQQHFKRIAKNPRAPRVLTFNWFIPNPWKIKRNGVWTASGHQNQFCSQWITSLPPTCRHMCSLMWRKSCPDTARTAHPRVSRHALITGLDRMSALKTWTGPRVVYTHTDRLKQTASDCNLGDFLTLRLTLGSVWSGRTFGLRVTSFMDNTWLLPESCSNQSNLAARPGAAWAQLDTTAGLNHGKPTLGLIITCSRLANDHRQEAGF